MELLGRLARRRIAIVGLVIIAVFVAVAIGAPWIAPYDPEKPDVMQRLEGPSAAHLLGTDTLGRDILSRIVYGSRISFISGLTAVGIALVIGTLLGLVSGYAGGRVDDIIMRAMDVLLSFPGILLAIGVVAVLGPGLFNAMVAIGIARTPGFARLVRSTTLTLKEREFIQSSIAAGANTPRILFFHILPNTINSLIVLTTLSLGTALISCASLGFLGLGAQPPTPEWGAMLSSGRNFLLNAPHIATFPGLAIALMVFGFNSLGDGLRDALDPRMKNVGVRVTKQ